MTEDDKKLLSTFEARLRHLMYLHDELKREYALTKQLLDKQKEDNKKLEDEYRKLKVDYINIKTAKTIALNDTDFKETRQRLFKLVREVDKCIALLNE